MAKTYLQLVNHKLACARVLLRALEPLAVSDSAAQRLEQQALIDACCFHLVCAYRHYLRELAQNYGVKLPAGIASEAQLQSALAELDKTAAEVQELQVLRQQPDSWLSRLHSHYESSWELPSEATVPSEAAAQGLIQVHHLDSKPEAVDYPALQRWHDDFVALIGRHRETSTEY